jgi:hypothetical protein
VLIIHARRTSGEHFGPASAPISRGL